MMKLLNHVVSWFQVSFFFLGGGEQEGGTKENKLPSKRKTEQNQRNEPK
jgi:hypothetical protein